MKTFKAFVTAVLVLSVQPALGEEPVALLVEETADGSPGETILVEGVFHEPLNEAEARAAEENWWETLRITSAVTVTAPLPFVSVGGRVGVTTGNEMIEIGGEAELFVIPPGETGPHGGAMGASIGAYLQLAPIPGKWGKRFYIMGRVFRAFSLGRPSFDAWGAGGALGYRQPFGDGRYAFVELGLERDYLFTYEDVLITPRLTAGVRF